MSCSYKSSEEIAVEWSGNLEDMEFETASETDDSGYKHFTLIVSSFNTFNRHEITCKFTNEIHAFEEYRTTSVWKRGFTNPPPDLLAVTDGDVSLKCGFGSPFASVEGQWLVNDNSAPTVLTSAGTGEYQLTLNSFKMSSDRDGEDHTCQFSDETGDTFKTSFKLAYAKTDILDKNNGRIVINKANNKLECKVTSRLVTLEKFQWFDSSGSMIQTSEYVSVSHDDTENTVSLTFTSFIGASGGAIKCRHVNQEDISDEINVEIADVSIATESDSYIKNYDDIILTCTVFASDPDTAIVWTMNNIPVSRYEAYHQTEESLIEGERKSILTVHDFKDAPFQSNINYACAAKTSSDLMKSETITFHFVIIKSKKEYNFVSTSWKIECAMKVPETPVVTWYKDDKVVSAFSRDEAENAQSPYYITANKDERYFLELVGGSIQHSGSYKCSFTFESMPTVTSDDISVHLHLMSIIPDDGSMVMLRPGEALHLECELSTEAIVSDIVWRGLGTAAPEG